MKDFYIAAPFFNEQQVRLLEEIEDVLRNADKAFYSPRLNGLNKQKGPIDRDRAENIFTTNVGQLMDVRVVLAVLDWKLPLNQELRLIHTEFINDKESHTSYYKSKFTSPPILLPDSGTVWEMGWAFAKGIPINIYTDRKPNEPLNVMLVQCAEGIICGIDHLREYINGLKPLDKYKGVYR